MIAQVKADIKAEKKLLKAMKELSPNMLKNWAALNKEYGKNAP